MWYKSNINTVVQEKYLTECSVARNILIYQKTCNRDILYKKKKTGHVRAIHPISMFTPEKKLCPFGWSCRVL